MKRGCKSRLLALLLSMFLLSSTMTNTVIALEIIEEPSTKLTDELDNETDAENDFEMEIPEDTTSEDTTSEDTTSEDETSSDLECLEGCTGEVCDCECHKMNHAYRTEVEVFLEEVRMMDESTPTESLEAAYNRISNLFDQLNELEKNGQITPYEKTYLYELMNASAGEVVMKIMSLGYDPYAMSTLAITTSTKYFPGTNAGELRSGSALCLDAANDTSSPYHGILHVDEFLPKEYGPYGVILGLKEADSLTINIPDRDNTKVTYATDTDATHGRPSNYSEADFKGVWMDQSILASVDASAQYKSTLCGNYSVTYHNIGTYDGEIIDLKVTLVDYEAIGNSPVIGLRTTENKPGVAVLEISWIKLKYEFLDTSGNIYVGDDGEGVKGNTSYYDVDCVQVVHMHDGTQGIYVTGTPGNDCKLHIGSISGESGYSMFETVGFNANPGDYNGQTEMTQYAFTEIFKGSVFSRTYSFKNSDASGGGAIHHNGLPVTREGSLKVTKLVSGNAVPKDKEFEFTVTLDDTTINGEYGDMTFKDGVATFTLAHGEELAAIGLKKGTGYTVTENLTEEDYTVKINGVIDEDYTITGTVPDGTTALVVFNNNKNFLIDTGVFMDSAPYMILVAGVMAVAGGFILSKRRRFDD